MTKENSNNPDLKKLVQFVCHGNIQEFKNLIKKLQGELANPSDVKTLGFFARVGNFFGITSKKTPTITEEELIIAVNEAFLSAAANNQLGILKSLEEKKGDSTLLEYSIKLATQHGHIEILEYLLQLYSPEISSDSKTCLEMVYRQILFNAATSDKTELYKWIKETNVFSQKDLDFADYCAKLNHDEQTTLIGVCI